ncbi:hypothetical protein [Enhydrobacter aerosaccus]|nr:hypothetical protein [Enhydrobacter aerosaccus]
MDAEQRGEIDYVNRGFKRRHAIFLHDIHETIQFVRLARGDIVMPAEIRPFAYDHGLRLHDAMRLPLDQAEYVVVECCTDKHYEVAGWSLNVNEIHRHLVEPGGSAAREWWDLIDRSVRPSEALVQQVERELRAHWLGRWRLNDGHRQVLRELIFRYLSASEIAEGLAQLRTLLGRPFLVVPHVVVRLPDGRFLGERLQHVEKTIEAARIAGLPVLEPRTFVERDGQARALDKGGTDFHHYAAAYLPVVGREILEALRRNRQS